MVILATVIPVAMVACSTILWFLWLQLLLQLFL